MDKMIALDILNVQEKALTDKEYLHLHEDYSLAQETLRKLFAELSPQQQDVFENYLLSAIPLHHRLVTLAIEYGRNSD